MERKRLGRLFHAGGVLGWVITAGVLLGYVAPCVLALRASVGAELWSGGGDDLPSWPVVLVWLVLAVVGGVAIRKRLRWQVVLGALAINVATMGYLRWDVVAPCPLPVLGPLRDEADPHWDTVAWMMDKHPKSRTSEARLKPDVAMAIRLPSDRAAWAEHVRAHRQEILDAWEADSLGREWIDELCRRPPQGVHFSRHDDPMLSFQRVRASLHARMAYTYLRATEGERDEAVRLVLPELVAWQNLQRCEAMLVHQMIAVVIRNEAMKTINGILDIGTVESATLQEIRSALDGACPVGEVFRFGFLGDYCYSRSFSGALDRNLTEDESRILLGTLGLDSPVLILQSRLFGYSWLVQKAHWQREYLTAMLRVVSLAAARDLQTLKRESEEADRRWAIKNALGVRLMGMAMPAFSKVADNIWVMEDARVALRKRVDLLSSARE